MDLARAKSEALDNIFSSFKQNIKSCNAKRGRKRRTVKNNNRSNQHNSNFARAAHFFVHYFAAVLHDYNVKLLETSKGLFTWSGGPRSSGVGFFCFHALEDTKQKKPTPVDQGPPHGYMVCLWYGLKVGRVYGHVIITKFSWMGRSALNPIGRSPFLSS